jgi:hypothetical protein
LHHWTQRLHDPKNLAGFKYFLQSSSWLVIELTGDEVVVGSDTPRERALSILLVPSAKLHKLGCL